MKNVIVLVYCTCPVDPPEVAETLARNVVEHRLAACVNRLPQVQSTYRWDDAVVTDEEVLLIIKTRAKHLDTLFTRMKEWHPYELPELIAVPVQTGSAEYLAWVAEET